MTDTGLDPRVIDYGRESLLVDRIVVAKDQLELGLDLGVQVDACGVLVDRCEYTVCTHGRIALCTAQGRQGDHGHGGYEFKVHRMYGILQSSM